MFVCGEPLLLTSYREQTHVIAMTLTNKVAPAIFFFLFLNSKKKRSTQ